MQKKEQIYSVLVVSSSEQFNTSLRALLSETEFAPVHTAASVSRAQRAISERSYDLIIINTPLHDDFGQKLAVDCCQGKSTVSLLLVKSDVYDEVNSKVSDCGVLTMKKPVSTASMRQTLDWMKAMRERLRGLEKKALSLEEKMAEIRIVNRAKWALIDACKMTEADAHRFIEKQAMDRCVTRREIAEGILNTYK